jgi:hypothetical protein
VIRTGRQYLDSIRDGREVFWWDKRRATDTILESLGGIVTRVGDETVGEIWSLFDGHELLAELDPQFSPGFEVPGDGPA